MKRILTSFLLIAALAGCVHNPPAPEVIIQYKTEDIIIPYATLEKEAIPKSGITSESTEYDLILYIQVLKTKIKILNSRMDATIEYLEKLNARD